MQQRRASDLMVDVLAGAGLGAGLSFFFSRAQGARHRALVRDKAVKLLRDTEKEFDIASRDLAHRATGLAYSAKEALSLFRHEPGRGSADDAIITERVRSKVGRLVSHPGAIEVVVREGRVRLSGPVLSHEVERLLSGVRRVRGVRDVRNDLELHRTEERIPSLQGGSQRRGQVPDIFQTHWSPSTRVIVMGLGIAGLRYGARARNLPGTVVAGLGAVGILRAYTDLDVRRLFGLGGRTGIRLHKTVHIRAPRPVVFDFFSHPERFPQFMQDVLDVRSVQDHSHWRIRGPLGAPLSWDTELTRVEPDRKLYWRSTAGSLIQHAGSVEIFDEAGGCKVEIEFSYNPPAGYFGHALAVLIGSGPKHKLDRALMELKSHFELVELVPASAQQARKAG